MPSLTFILAFIGASIGLLVGIMIFSQVADILDCSTIGSEGFKKECEKAKDIGWTVIGLLPIALFFAIFAIFGGLHEGISMPKIPKLSRKLITTSQKIMVFIGLAKVKKHET